MLSPNITTPQKEKMEFDPIPADVYQVELLDISDKQAPTYNDKTKMETVLSFQFVLLEGKDGEKDLRGRNIWRNFVPNYFYEGNKGKNTTMQIVEAILGRERTIEEIAWWGIENWNDLLGKQLRVVIENTTKDKKTYSNIKTFMKKKGDLTPLTEEEKEKAKVKKKEEEKAEKEEEEINIDNINMEISEPIAEPKDF